MRKYWIAIIAIVCCSIVANNAVAQVVGPTISPCSVEKAAQDMAAEIKKRASAMQVDTIAMIDFLCNGGAKTKLTEAVRDKVQEALLSGNGPELVDRKDVPMLAEEGGAQGEIVSPHPSTALLMGEVICQPGGNIGYLIYRVYHTMNMRILAAGFVPVEWNEREKRLLNGPSYRAATAALPFIPQDQLENMVAKVKSRVACGIAMVYDGGEVESNTAESRVAFAQILAALYHGGLSLFEREYYQQAATEASVAGRVVGPNRVGALGSVQVTSSSGEENALKLKITAYPKGSLLSVVTLTQQRGATFGAGKGNDDENNLNSLISGMEKEQTDVKLVYEYECLLTEDYIVPEEVFGEKKEISFNELAQSNEEGGDIFYVSIDVEPGAKMVDAKELMLELVKVQYRKTANKNEVKKMLRATAAVGAMTRDEEGVYVGPLQLCLSEARQRLQFRENGNVDDISTWQFLSDIQRGEKEISGTYDGGYLPKFTYKTDITWAGGLPYKVKCRVDFTPGKKNIIKKTSKN